MIPKIAHRVWLKMSDDDVIPERFEAYWQRFAELHPDWELRTWTDLDEVRSWIRCGEVFDRATTNAGRADVTRYELMYRFGGVYLDTDVEPLRSFDDLLDGPPFAGWEDGRDRLVHAAERERIGQGLEAGAEELAGAFRGDNPAAEQQGGEHRLHAEPLRQRVDSFDGRWRLYAPPEGRNRERTTQPRPPSRESRRSSRRTRSASRRGSGSGG